MIWIKIEIVSLKCVNIIRLGRVDNILFGRRSVRKDISCLVRLVEVNKLYLN